MDLSQLLKIKEDYEKLCDDLKKENKELLEENKKLKNKICKCSKGKDRELEKDINSGLKRAY